MLSDSAITLLSFPKKKGVGKRKKKRQTMVDAKLEEDPSKRLRRMTPYDEHMMLGRLEDLLSVRPTHMGDEPLDPWETQRLCHQRNLLYRKLMLRQVQRENGQEVFDLEKVCERLAEKYHGIKPQKKVATTKQYTVTSHHPHRVRTLDRFMRWAGRGNMEDHHMSFQTRLVGFEDHQLQPLTSPYTMRVLEPFILRDTETVPLKVKLMQEIIAFPHRNDPTWEPPPPASIDYLYVRPQHIPSVNALCCQYFWPGIDMSECLQYPDFSCVAMYRKLVVGFAFLVPDVNHSEAYISMMLTRPDWRRAGIASFMLYHLCQTCMGKDITLHVSATNPAMLLYQRFGFKAQELCLGFYDKYLPPESHECKHAFLMRLR